MVWGCAVLVPFFFLTFFFLFSFFCVHAFILTFLFEGEKGPQGLTCVFNKKENTE